MCHLTYLACLMLLCTLGHRGTLHREMERRDGDRNYQKRLLQKHVQKLGHTSTISFLLLTSPGRLLLYLFNILDIHHGFTKCAG